MSTLTVRVRPHTYQIPKDLARENNESLPDALERLVEELRRWRILQEANEAHAAVAADPVADAAWQEEIARWDATLVDGLDALPESPEDR